ncbi:helix-turn-helix transcriptional regulator [Streptomyces broussonetiae]|uniref:Helix-turn-helix transcriptional regulator n=1 Tax=Streptomyces broussonetiae TaxID=2686304 RepID=A0ABV5EKI1_9ACTN
MTRPPHPEHGVEDLCDAGTQLYDRTLAEGRIAAADAESAPCLLDLGLLSPALDDPRHLESVPPALALHRLLRTSANRVADERQREVRLTRTFEPLMRKGGQPAAAPHSPIRVLSGVERINQALTEALSEAEREVLCIQPNSKRTLDRKQQAQAIAMARDQALLDRGGRIRTLYQHTQRHVPLVVNRYEQLRGDAQARTLDEITDRLIVVDRKVAFVPGDKDRVSALEIRIPALVGFFATTFDRLRRLATPMYPETVAPPALNGVTHRQRAIATLLVEGHTDAVRAERLGMNIRTAREHIAKLSATLGSESRAQLGYLIAQSGILKQEGTDE